MKVAIRRCSCEHNFQDKTYGKYKRVMNKTTSGYRCTICQKISTGTGK